MSTTFKPTFKVNNVVFSPSLKGENPSSFGGASGAGVKWEHILGKPSVFPPAEHSHPEYAPLLSPEFTGEPTAPTPEEGDNSNRIATTAFVQNAVEIFIATYSETAYSEVLEAYESGKMIFAIDPGDPVSRIYTLASSFLVGDVDLDGDLDAADQTALARHVGKIQLLEDPQAIVNADVNFDGVLNAQDLTRMGRLIAFGGGSDHTFTFVSVDSLGDAQAGPAVHTLYLSPSNNWDKRTLELVAESDIPTRTSELTNDSGFIAEAALDGMASKGWVEEQGYITEVGTLYHPQLEARGDPDQHPIEAITSLEGELSVRPSEVMSNNDILSILLR